MTDDPAVIAAPCPGCGGAGYVTGHGCCGNVRDNGECCGEAVQTQLCCPYCNGMCFDPDQGNLP